MLAGLHRVWYVGETLRTAFPSYTPIERKLVAVLYTAYFDESGTHEDSNGEAGFGDRQRHRLPRASSVHSGPFRTRLSQRRRVQRKEVSATTARNRRHRFYLSPRRRSVLWTAAEKTPVTPISRPT